MLGGTLPSSTQSDTGRVQALLACTGHPFSSWSGSQREDQEFEQSARSLLLIDPRPGLNIVDANKTHVEATMIDREKVIGKRLFEVFPANPGDPIETGVTNLFASLNWVIETGKPHAMAVQRYDVRNPAGIFVERHWQPLNTPIFDDQGKLTLILHQVIDVTAQVRQQRPP
jgi:hypothetical protein